MYKNIIGVRTFITRRVKGLWLQSFFDRFKKWSISAAVFAIGYAWALFFFSEKKKAFALSDYIIFLIFSYYWLFLPVISAHYYLIKKKIKEIYLYYIVSFLYFGGVTFPLMEIFQISGKNQLATCLSVSSAFMGILIAFLQRYLFRDEELY